MLKRCLAIATCFVLGGAAPEDVIVKGKRLNDDIIVEGSRTTLAPGLWSIQAGPGMMTTTSSGDTPDVVTRRTRTAVPAFQWQVCLPGETLAMQVSQLVVEGAATGCSPIRFRQRGDRLIADFTCTNGPVDREVAYSGTATPRSVDLRANTVAGSSYQGVDTTTETQSRVFANRLGECPATSINQPAPIRDPIFTASVRSAPLTDDLTPAPAVMPRGVPIGAPAQPDDIVVVARKLMNLRLRYASDGRILTNCANTRPSGDQRIDRIGCAVLRACVASGSEYHDTTLACFNTRIMSLVASLHAAPAAQYRGKAGYIER